MTSFSTVRLCRISLIGFLVTGAGLALGPRVAAAQTTGKILGVVQDDVSGAALPDAVITVQPHGLSALSVDDGRFVITGVPVGTVDLTVELIGYRQVTLEGVAVGIGRTRRLTILLTQTAIELDPLVVEADRQPLIEPQVTTSHTIISGDELLMLPIDAVEDAIELTPGVNEGSFRGGRVGQEAYVVDGLQLKNQFEASTQGLGLELAPTSLQEIDVVLGGFSAEYGTALSGVVSFITRRGDPHRWTGSARILSDYWTPNISQGFAQINAYAGGPLKFLGEGATLYADLFMQGLQDADPRARGLTCVERDDADPDLGAAIDVLTSDPASAALYCPFTPNRLPHQQGDKLIGFLRFDTPLSRNISISASFLRNRFQRQLYTRELKYNATDQLAQRFTGSLLNLAFDWRKNARGRSYTVTVRGAGLRLDRYLGALDPVAFSGRNTAFGIGLSDFKFLGEDFVRRPINEQLADGRPVPGYVQPGGTVGSPFGPAAEGILFTEGTSEIANWSVTDLLALDAVGEYTALAGNSVRVGGQGRFYRIEAYERVLSYLPGSAPSYARFYPSNMAGFADVRLLPGELLALNFGIRVEAFRSDLGFVGNRQDFLAPVESPSWKTSLLPRVGIAGAFENSGGQTSFRFSYTGVSQPPDFRFFLDTTIGDSLRTDIKRQGNPDLSFEDGRMFEFGIEHVFQDVVGLGLTAYRKELDALVTGNIGFAGIAPGQFSTGDRGTIQGIELTVRGRWPVVELRAGYVLQKAEGIGSSAIDDSVVVPGDQLVEFPLAFDQRHTLDFLLFLGRASGAPSWNFGAALTTRIRSGTPVQRDLLLDPSLPTAEIERLPWTSIVDLRLTYDFGSFPGCATCHWRLLLDGRNIFGSDNVIALRRDTGGLAPALETVEEKAAMPGTFRPIPRESPDYSAQTDLNRDGVISSDEFSTARFAAALDSEDPSLFFSEPRQVRFGVEILF